MSDAAERKIRIAVVGLGKMGLSHFALVNAHPAAETLACDATGFLVEVKPAAGALNTEHWSGIGKAES